MLSIRSKITIFILLMQVFTAAISFAAPAVTGISGTATNGSALTVTGTGFGATGPNILLFDNFETGTNGNNISTTANSATVGAWSSLVSGCDSRYPVYTNQYAHGGSQSMKSDWNTTCNEPSIAAIETLSLATEIFYSYWTTIPVGFYIPGQLAGGYSSDLPMWKIAWVYETSTATTDPTEYNGPIIMSDTFSTSNSYSLTSNSPNGRVQGGYITDHMAKSKWTRWDTYIKAGVTDGIIQLFEFDNINGRITQQNQSSVYTAPAGHGWGNVRIPGYARGHTNPSITLYDDVYISVGACARARVEIGDAATYATSKNLSIATGTSWSDTSITATVRQGSFSNFNTAYLYVIDANGNVNADGYPLCPTCPRKPTNLTIQ